MLQARKGITLIEGLVAIAAVALILVLFTVALFGARREARDVKRVSDVQVMRSSLASIKVQFGSYLNADCQAGPVSDCVGGNLAQLLPSIENFNDPNGRQLCSDNCNSTCEYSFGEFTDTSYEMAFFLEKGLGNLDSKGCYLLTQDGISRIQ